MAKHLPNTYIDPFKDFKLFEANDIAKYGLSYAMGQMLSPMAYKGVLYLIWKAVTQEDNALQKDENHVLCARLSVSEFGAALGYNKSDPNRNYARSVKAVCEAVKEAQSQKIQIHDPEKKDFISFYLIPYIDVDYGQDRMYVEFPSRLRQYFGPDIRKDFTVVSLKYLNRLNRLSSVILYPFFSRYKNMGSFNYDVKNITKLLTGQEDYPYKYIKHNHMDPAIAEINSKTNTQVEYEEIKNGKSVVTLRFHVTFSPADDETQRCIEYNRKNPELYPDENEYHYCWKNESAYDMSAGGYKDRVSGDDLE